ncbi:MAG: hypothetical protein B6U68_00350 [Candidatus Aenigmarchaeota archaeon ex4484_14]|nr:MAG: hypothetical protein B6U68_00350 [Candidatus Aenigmarchaeota archaeon ex4484_14]
MKKFKITLKEFVALFIPLYFISWILHELGHYAVFAFLGYGSKVRILFDHCFFNAPFYMSEKANMLMFLAGPLVNLFLAFIAYYLFKKTKKTWDRKFFFVFSQSNILTRIAVYIRQIGYFLFFRLPFLNDEFRVSERLGFGPLLLPFLFGIIFSYILFSLYKDLDQTKGKKIIYLVTSFIVSYIIIFFSIWLDKILW